MSQASVCRRLQSFKITAPIPLLLLLLVVAVSSRPLIIYLTVYHRVAVN